MAKHIDLKTGIIMTLGAFVASSGLATAQDQASARAVIEEQSSNETLSEDLIGLSVVTQQDGTERAVGSVEALLFDEDDALTGVVVSVGGFLGFGAKQVALSYDAIDLQKANGAPVSAVIDMTREQLEDAPAFKTQAVLRQEREQERIRREIDQQQPPPPSDPLQ
jgi:hypothetical protein